MKDKNSLGRANLRQVSLEANVDQISLEKKILNQINLINLSEDKYENEIYKNLINFGKLHFAINKHEELYCSKVNDVNKLITTPIPSVAANPFTKLVPRINNTKQLKNVVM